MSLRWKRRRKREQRRLHTTQPARRFEPACEVREVDDRWLLPGWTLGAARELEAVYGTALRTPSEDVRDADEAPPPGVPPASRGLHEAREVERLAYTRRQAAEALGVSISTIDRHVVPSISRRSCRGDSGSSQPTSSSASYAATSRQRELAELDVLPVARRRFLRASSSGSVSSTRAVAVSPRSPARSRTRACRRRTEGDGGGRRRYALFSSVRVRPGALEASRRRALPSLTACIQS
jgi:hypothetical protein